MTKSIFSNKNSHLSIVVGKNGSMLEKIGMHARTLGFIHPKTNEEMIFSSILPQELNNLLKMLRNTSE